jgi:hypothetical protein
MFKKSRIILSDPKFKIIKDNLKLEHIPREGDFLFFNDDTNYWVVQKVIYNISNKNNIWIIIIPLETN